jgi:hypothetical protein
VHLLLVAGPYLCAHLLQREREQPDPEISLIRAELVAFLREAVRLRGSDGFGYGIGLTGPVSFGGKPTKVGVLVAITASLRDAAILQLLALLEQVGLNQVRRCAAPDCDRLFVKHYRQTFHSLRCQQREIKRRKRDRDRERDDRERDAQQTRARRRRVTRKRGHR